jgi:hypothetical protein
LIIQEQTKIELKDAHHQADKTLKNPCKIHGGHEWEDCRANPKNQKQKEENPKKNSKEANQWNPWY